MVREAGFANALIAHVPEQALQGLRHRFGDISITLDAKFSIHAPGGNRGKPPKDEEPTDPVDPPAEPGQETPYGISLIKADQAHALNQGQDIVVCVIDSGTDMDHPDLVDNLVGGKNYVVKKGRINSSDYDDDNGHGTHVAGTIAAVDNNIGVIGVAPRAKIFTVKALDRRGSGYLSDITDGIYDCINAGAAVINMSLGGAGDPQQDSPLKTAIQAAVAQGLYVVVAAGNEGTDQASRIPAGYNETISVAAVDAGLNFPSWTNYGLSAKDITAPGVAVKSTWKNGDYNTISGTSMASPHVAGVVALMVEAQANGLLADDLGKATSQQGAGLVNALNTVQTK